MRTQQKGDAHAREQRVKKKEKGCWDFHSNKMHARRVRKEAQSKRAYSFNLIHTHERIQAKEERSLGRT